MLNILVIVFSKRIQKGCMRITILRNFAIFVLLLMNIKPYEVS